MTSMPQLVAVFNGVGGLAAALVALLELPRLHTPFEFLVAGFTLVVGGIAFSGSMVTYLKLDARITTQPILFFGARFFMTLFMVLCLGLTAYGAFAITELPVSKGQYGAIVIALAVMVGILFVLPISGADVPITISLLNAFTGLTTAASGMILQSTLLIIAGVLIGASGTILTQIMARAMGRSLASILFSAFKSKPKGEQAAEEDLSVRTVNAEDVAIQLSFARKVVIVPGYGLAVAQAQHVVRELAENLQTAGVQVAYAIHPVAGRMPGHMNVLLAEAEVPYDQ